MDEDKDDRVLDTGYANLTRVLTNVSITNMYIHCSAPFCNTGTEVSTVSPIGLGKCSCQNMFLKEPQTLKGKRKKPRAQIVTLEPACARTLM